MIGYYNYTVILTYVGTMFGFAGIASIWSGNLRLSLICLLLAGLCDMFDGKIASTRQRTRAERHFGIEIDSLSDVICFGVLPSLIIFHCSGQNLWYAPICALYMLAALVRLAWFNVDEEERQKTEDGVRKTYLGLPVTTSTLLIPFVISLLNLIGLDMRHICPWVLLCMGAAFLTPFRLHKPHTVGKIVMIVLGIGCLVVVLLGVPG
ncbi:MAG: CDP-alcohol phosphatidyltransferase family protein [Clostridia bacterium]|nr:CDP-alcohol phosphatidyltransferase family protein [Clostridia bacterium]